MLVVTEYPAANEISKSKRKMGLHLNSLSGNRLSFVHYKLKIIDTLRLIKCSGKL